MITGTNHFVSISAANKYYSNYFGPDAASFVKTKIKNAEIVIGTPKLKDGQKLFKNKDEGRYFIED